MFDKIFSGIVSFTILLFSSYTGNDPFFTDFLLSRNDSAIVVSTAIANAFENDFENFFKSGKTIAVYYELCIYKNGFCQKRQKFKHTVVYDALTKEYTLLLEEQNLSVSTTEYKQMIDWYSSISVSFDEELLNNCQIEIKAELRTLTLHSAKKTFDMMTLWKFKTPSKRMELKW